MSDEFRLSFEFFPPKTDQGRANLMQVAEELSQFQPEFFSVTYGAGGSTRDNTKNIVQALLDLGLSVAPHLSFGGDEEPTILKLLHEYEAMGVRRIVALRGDRPSGMGGGSLMIAAIALVLPEKAAGIAVLVQVLEQGVDHLRLSRDGAVKAIALVRVPEPEEVGDDHPFRLGDRSRPPAAGRGRSPPAGSATRRGPRSGASGIACRSAASATAAP